MTSMYLFTAVIGGSWTLQLLLEREGKDEDANIARAIGYGGMIAVAIRFGLEVKATAELFGLWFL